MKVSGLFVKLDKGAPVAAPADGRLLLIPGLGIEGDANANPISPRQVLIAFARSVAGLGLQPGDLKENLLLDGVTERDLPSGTLVRVGEAAVRITFPCEPCGYLRSVGVEKPASAAGRRGMLGVVIEGGTVRVGDRAEILIAGYPAVPERLTERLGWILDRMPEGHIVDYLRLAHLAGVSRAYLRAFPNILRRLGAEGGSVHRVVDSKRRPIAAAQDQAARLAREGVTVETAPMWEGRGLYNSTREVP